MNTTTNIDNDKKSNAIYSMITDLNKISNRNKKRIRDFIGAKRTKELIESARADGVDLGKKPKTQEKRAYKYFGDMYNAVEQDFKDTETKQKREKKALEKSKKRRNKKIEKTLKILKIAQPIDSAFRGKFEVYRVPLNLKIPDKKSHDKEYIAKILKSKVRKQLKIFETRLRGRSLKVFFGVEYLGMSTDKETGSAFMAEQEGILELYNYNTEKANADPRMKKLSEKFQKENTKVKNITTKPTIMLNSKNMWKTYLEHLKNILADMFKEQYGEICIYIYIYICRCVYR